jgi:hypothetical protein
MGGGERGMGCADQSKACVTVVSMGILCFVGGYTMAHSFYTSICFVGPTGQSATAIDCSIRPWAHSRPPGPAKWRGLVEAGSGQVEVALGRVEVALGRVEVG